MKFNELKQQSHMKILLRAESGRGKTYRACRVALNVSEQGGEVLYLDTEAEGSTTMVQLVEDDSTDYTQESVTNVEYVQVGTYEEVMRYIGKDEGQQSMYDLVVFDTLDHKHSYVLKHVTDAKRESGADWQEYASIYAEEKEMMEALGKPEANILATLDPESGGMDKPKGSQTNVHGYFTVVLDLLKDGDSYANRIRNWVGHGDKVGASHPRLTEKLTEEVTDRISDSGEV
jgi:hypothetical protein